MGSHLMEAIIATSAIMIGSIQEALRTPIVGGTTTHTHTRTIITATPGIIQRTHIQCTHIQCTHIQRTHLTRHQRSIQPITTIRSRTIITTPGGQPMSMAGVAQPITIPIVGLGTPTILGFRDEFVSRKFIPSVLFQYLDRFSNSRIYHIGVIGSTCSVATFMNIVVLYPIGPDRPEIPP
jgi:hypothetical protein